MSTYTPIEDGVGTPESLLKDVLDGFEQSQRFLTPYFPRWLRWYKMYRNYVAPKSRPWRANIAVPIAFANVEHGIALMMDQWNQRPVVKVFPRGGEDYDTAKITQEYLSWEFDDIPAFLPVYDITQDLLLYGTGWGKVYWDWDADRNTLESVSPWNLYPDPAAESLDDAEYVIHRALRSPAYIKRLIRAGIYQMDEADVDKMAKEGLAWSADADNLLSQVGLGSSEAVKNRIEVLECWKEDPRTRVTALNRRLIVRAGPNRFPHRRKPFVRFVDHSIAHELLGISEVEVIEKICDAINDAESQKFDVVSLAINNMLAYNRQAGIDPDELVYRPGGMVGVNGDPRAALLPLVQNASGIALADQEINRLRFYVQEGTGNWAYNQGQTPERREAPTTVLALQRAAGVRFAAKIRRNEEEALKRLADMMITNAARLGPSQKWIRITGQDKPVQIETEALEGQWDFVWALSTAEPKDALRRRFVELLPFLKGMGRLNEEGALEYVGDLWEIPKEKLILSPEQYAQKLQMEAAARMAQRSNLPNEAPGAVLPQDRVPVNVEDIAGMAQELLGAQA